MKKQLKRLCTVAVARLVSCSSSSSELDIERAKIETFCFWKEITWLDGLVHECVSK